MHVLTIGLVIVSATAETLKVGDLAQGSEFTKCINTTDFNSKTLTDEVEVTDKADDGCCPEGYIPGIKHYNKYWGAMVVCGFKDDGNVAMSTSTSNGVNKCDYHKCYVVKMDVTCKDDSKMTLDGCCPKDQWDDNCKMYSKSQTFFKEKVDYCLSYAKKYKMEGTSDKTDDQVDGALSLTNLYTYTACAGAFGGEKDGSTTGGSGGALSCNVGTKTTYSGCGAGLADADTFKETDCSASGGDKCMTLQYSAEGGGCTTSSAVGYCITKATNCEYYDKTYKDQPAYKGYKCTECDTNNCNTKETNGGGAAPATTSNAHGAVTSIAMVAAIGIVA